MYPVSRPSPGQLPSLKVDNPAGKREGQSVSALSGRLGSLGLGSSQSDQRKVVGLTDEQVRRFFQRVDFCSPVERTVGFLGKLHRSCAECIPFENLDLIVGRKKELPYDTQSVFDKIVERGRGGICYEVNGLLHDVLNALAFDVSCIKATVLPSEDSDVVCENSHMVLAVTVEGVRWLCDFGYGRDLACPHRMVEGGRPAVVEAERREYCLDHSSQQRIWTLKCRDKYQQWTTVYTLSGEPVDRNGFDKERDFIAHSEHSSLNKKLLASQWIPDGGRVTLSGSLLKVTSASGDTTSQVVDARVELHKVFFKSADQKTLDLLAACRPETFAEEAEIEPLPTHYILKNQTVVPVDTSTAEGILAWSRWFGEADRMVAMTEFGKGNAVSTVFLGVDYSCRRSPQFPFVFQPKLFETMVFGGDFDGKRVRSSTWSEAKEAHDVTVELVKLGSDVESDTELSD